MDLPQKRQKLMEHVQVLDDLLTHDHIEDIIRPGELAASQIQVEVGAHEVDVEPAWDAAVAAAEVQVVRCRRVSATVVQDAGPQSQQVELEPQPGARGEDAARRQVAQDTHERPPSYRGPTPLATDRD